MRNSTPPNATFDHYDELEAPSLFHKNGCMKIDMYHKMVRVVVDLVHKKTSEALHLQWLRYCVDDWSIDAIIQHIVLEK
ncbi:hypothetical protein MAM1_0192d07687 [Mucor ambiguus]|uniref:Uncharacterized protein n=1 Tax=Mucor ambiguus TaxID=91626 RepID=A0A0C9LWA4_9FUNG|nr:hypothetical protein MAM1_0192d07687 [Mucor ambiguus]